MPATVMRPRRRLLDVPHRLQQAALADLELLPARRRLGRARRPDLRTLELRVHDLRQHVDVHVQARVGRRSGPTCTPATSGNSRAEAPARARRARPSTSGPYTFVGDDVVDVGGAPVAGVPLPPGPHADGKPDRHAGHRPVVRREGRPAAAQRAHRDRAHRDGRRVVDLHRARQLRAHVSATATLSGTGESRGPSLHVAQRARDVHRAEAPHVQPRRRGGRGRARSTTVSRYELTVMCWSTARSGTAAGNTLSRIHRRTAAPKPSPETDADDAEDQALGERHERARAAAGCRTRTSSRVRVRVPRRRCCSR